MNILGCVFGNWQSFIKIKNKGLVWSGNGGDECLMDVFDVQGAT